MAVGRARPADHALFIELTEALDCPDCREGLGLVAFIERLDDRRIVDGHLGCPGCEAEFPIRGGAIELGRVSPGGAEEPDPSPGGAGDSERALHIAALLGLRERKGSRVILAGGLARTAPAVLEFSEQVELFVLTGSGDADRPGRLAAGITVLRGARPDRWPTRAGALDGVALLGGTPEEAREAERALRPGGRLVVLDPSADLADAVDELGFVLLAAEPQALVAERQ